MSQRGVFSRYLSFRYPICSAESTQSVPKYIDLLGMYLYHAVKFWAALLGFSTIVRGDPVPDMIDAPIADLTEYTLRATAAGIPFALRLDDEQLYRELQTSLGPCRPTSTQIAPFELTVLPSGHKHIRDATAGEPLDGCDEYEGYVDLVGHRGGVTFTGGVSPGALANCLRQICTELTFMDDGAILHAAYLADDKGGYVFAGRSGAGKSTVCELSSHLRVLSDDLIAVRRQAGQYLAWGLPRAELHTEARPVTIRAVFVLRQSRENRLVPLAPAAALAHVLALPTRTMKNVDIGKVLALLDGLTNHVPCYELHFRKDPSFWKCIDSQLAAHQDSTAL